MTIWCPNCLVEQNEVKKLTEFLDNPDDLVPVSLDVSLNEDAATLKKYVDNYDFDCSGESLKYSELRLPVLGFRSVIQLHFG